mmetsp:Transcript_16236/g.32901  ORF Transcript_16236/g.32901 Transcript_16236/m.32901 type:complete len:202 (-) Transcript_16236:781-1386(-)
MGPAHSGKCFCCQYTTCMADNLSNHLFLGIHERGAIKAETHGAKTVVNVDNLSRDSGRQGGKQESCCLSNLHSSEFLRNRSVLVGVVDDFFNESDGTCSARSEGTGRDRVHTNFELAPSFVSKHAGIGFQGSLRTAHSSSVARDNFVRSIVGQRDDRATLIHNGAKVLHHRNQRVGRRRLRSKVSLSRSFQERLLHLWAVG